MNTDPILDIPDSAWRPLDGLEDPLSGLAGPTVTINGLSMHMEAWQVFDTADGHAPVDAWEDEYAALHSAVHADGPFQTLRIGERDYVIVLSPHSKHFCQMAHWCAIPSERTLKGTSLPCSPLQCSPGSRSMKRCCDETKG
jgi:hypothetical protein